MVWTSIIITFQWFIIAISQASNGQENLQLNECINFLD